MRLEYKNLIATFMKEFPEIVNENIDLIKELEWEISENIVYAFYEEIVRVTFHKLIKNLSSNNNNDILLNKLLNFFEEMAISDDFEVRNALRIAIFEFISEDVTILKKISKTLKQKSKIIFENSHNVPY